MKNLLYVLLPLITLNLVAQEDYTLKINNKVYQVALNENYNLTVEGKKITLLLTLKDTLVYNDSLFNFKYDKDYKISKLVIDEGVEQIMIMSAEGSGIAIQKYTTINPSMLNELMISEVTKESLNYGYEMKREDYTREVISGEKLPVSKAVLSYKDDQSIYEVASFGKKDEGIIIMTIISNKSMSEQGRKIIDLMWNSISLK